MNKSQQTSTLSYRLLLGGRLSAFKLLAINVLFIHMLGSQLTHASELANTTNGETEELNFRVLLAHKRLRRCRKTQDDHLSFLD